MKDMAKTTFIYAFVLLLFGLAGYFLGGEVKSTTALIPAGFGVLAGLCGLLALKPGLRMHAMHGAALVALIAALMHFGVFIMRVTTDKMGGPVSPISLGPQMMLLTAIASALFLVLCVRSFINARRARMSAKD